MGAAGHTYVSTDEEFIEILGLTNKAKKLPRTLGELFRDVTKFLDSKNLKQLEKNINEYGVQSSSLDLSLEVKLKLLGVEVDRIDLHDVSDMYDSCPIYTRTIFLKDGRVLSEERCAKKAKDIYNTGSFIDGYDFVFAYKPVIKVLA